MSKNFYSGTFIECKDGFHFSSKPPVDLIDPKYLRHSDPEIVMCSVLEHLKAGEFSVADRLVKLMHEFDDAYIWNGCAFTLTYAAPYSTLRGMLRSFDEVIYQGKNPEILWYFCDILAHSMGFWTISKLIEIYKLIEDRKVKNRVEVWLSHILEKDLEEIGKGPALRETTETNELAAFAEILLKGQFLDEEYINMLIKTHDILIAEKKWGENTPIFEGDVFSIQRVLEKLLVLVRSGEDSGRIEFGKMLLEATTGYNCAEFYDNENYSLRPLSASAIIEDVFFSHDINRYEPGKRYFFGHLIPD